MPKRIVHISRSKARKVFEQIGDEVSQRLSALHDEYHDEELPEELVDKLVRGARIGNNYEQRYRRNRSGRERGSLPQRPRMGLVTPKEFIDRPPLREDEEGYPIFPIFWDEELDFYISDYHIKYRFGLSQDDFNFLRYTKRKETYNGKWDYLTKEQKEKYAKINASIDAKLVRGENPFRPSRFEDR